MAWHKHGRQGGVLLPQNSAKAIDTRAEFADSPSVGCRLALGGSKAKTGEQIGERLESLKVEILYLQGLRDIFRGVSPHW